MKKRQSRNIADDSSQYESDLNISEDDWSESNKPVKRRKIIKKQPPDAPGGVVEGAQSYAKAAKHPSSRHVVKNVEEMRETLLAWYDQVHDKRGMPWRKRFDPSMTAEQRSQRAYEVFDGILENLQDELTENVTPLVTGLGIRDHAATDTGCYGNPLL